MNHLECPVGSKPFDEQFRSRGSAIRRKGLRGFPQPFLQALVRLSRFCLNPVNGLQRLDVRRLPSLGSLDDVELHSLTFLQTLETT